jgi:enolase-phosphatase E1
MAFAGRGILLDIEGTVAPIAFVTDVLFPDARRELAGFLARHWGESAVTAAVERVARDAGAPSFAAWAGPDAQGDEQRGRLVAHLLRLMDADTKATGLKEVQGLIWAEGYRAGRLRSELFPDVAPALRAWAGRGLDVRVFSSGSVAAQQVFFAHTDAGDLSGLLRGHYDTRVGPKRAPASYRAIVADMGLAAGEVLFLSDVAVELDAAAAAGLRAGLTIRPGNAAPPPDTPHPAITSFDQIRLP